MTVDSAGLQVLSPEECLRMLASARIGRVVFTDRALPAVQPVIYCLDGTDIVLRTAAGSTLAAATRNAVVAFEADDFDPDLRSGWSVTAVGHARAVHDPRELAGLAELPLTLWTPGERDHYVIIRAEQLSGRRIPR